jgi:hypothetical protein
MLLLTSNKIIGNGGAQALANGNLICIEVLVLYDNNITDEGIVTLADGNFPNLKCLHLGANKISDTGEELLKKKFGVKVIF